MPTVRAEAVWRRLVDAAMGEGCDPETVRVAAVVTLARASAGRARIGPLAGLYADDVDLKRGWVTLTHTRPGRGGGAPYRQAYPLGDGALVLLRRWHSVRDVLVAGLDNPASVLNVFVTVRPATRADGSLYPAGMPIHADGLITSYRRAAARLNAEHAGAYGWEPLPARFEQLRRAWQAG